MKLKDKQSLGREIFKVSYFKGQFKLRSGKTSTEYFDKYKFESDPHLLKKIAKALATLVPKKTEMLAGLEMGGLPLCVALSQEKKLPALFVRKSPKNYGSLKIAEGPSFQNKNVCVIEDVITTGGQVIQSVTKLRKEKALITHVLCVILRGEKEEVKKNMEFSSLKLKFLFHIKELKALRHLKID